MFGREPVVSIKAAQVRKLISPPEVRWCRLPEIEGTADDEMAISGKTVGEEDSISTQSSELVHTDGPPAKKDGEETEEISADASIPTKCTELEMLRVGHEELRHVSMRGVHCKKDQTQRLTNPAGEN